MLRPVLCWTAAQNLNVKSMFGNNCCGCHVGARSAIEKSAWLHGNVPGDWPAPDESGERHRVSYDVVARQKARLLHLASLRVLAEAVRGGFHPHCTVALYRTAVS